MGFAMVIDLNKCIGCQTCTVACKKLWTSDEGQESTWFNHVETLPGKGWPKAYDTMTPEGGAYKGDTPSRLATLDETGGNWDLDVTKVLPDKYNPADPLQATVQETGEKPVFGPNWEEDEGGGVFPNSFFFYMPRLCNHCDVPACKQACPRSVIKKRDDGIVLLDETKCRGYRFCVEACPYKKLYFNPKMGVSQKCVFCFPRVEGGEAPACVAQCAGRARHFGMLDNPESPTHKLVKKYKIALPLYAEKSTGPNVFYIPPFSPPVYNEDGSPGDEPRIPLDYLKELFGDEVEGVLATLEAEREKKARGEESEIMDELIRFKFSDSWNLEGVSG